MGNDTLIVELYDTFTESVDMSALEAVKEKFAHLSERDPGVHWYDSIKLPESISKKGKKAQERDFDALATEHFGAYLGANAPAVSDKAKKRELSARYVDGLLSEGGPSTDVFKRELGEGKTAELFRKVLFGTDL